jgi:hypothetical protein
MNPTMMRKPPNPLVAVPTMRKSSAIAPTIHVTAVGWNRLIFEGGFGSDTRVLSNFTKLLLRVFL